MFIISRIFFFIPSIDIAYVRLFSLECNEDITRLKHAFTCIHVLREEIRIDTQKPSPCASWKNRKMINILLA
jgi:hypothetical protein